VVQDISRPGIATMSATDTVVADREATVEVDRCVCVDNMPEAFPSSVPLSESVHAVGNQRTTFY
jgi:hypothetical protein